MNPACTWEEAVQWLREQPDQQELARHCFYDDPIEDAAKRFRATSEWQATRALLATHLPGRVLDLGAGRGIASYAFAVEGSEVTALEPDASTLVGRGAIEDLCRRTGVAVTCSAGFGEGLPFPDRSFDVVYGRAVLHHARDLPALMREVARVLRPGGRALFVREHVISRSDDLELFLATHSLHRLYGGEHAYRLQDYRSAFGAAGLRVHRELGPYESAVNYWPSTAAEIRDVVEARVRRRLGRPLAGWLMRSPRLQRFCHGFASRACGDPGRLYAFLGEKP